VSTRPTGPQRPSGRPLASSVGCRAAAAKVNSVARTRYWRGTTSPMSGTNVPRSAGRLLAKELPPRRCRYVEGFMP
jgi:hypothetical protein